MRARLEKLRRATAMPHVYTNWATAYRNRLARGRGRAGGGTTVTYRLRSGPTLEMSSGPSDIRILNEVFLDTEYEHQRFAFPPGGTVVDIGAHKGSFTAWALNRQPDLRIVCFEPNPRSFKLLHRNVGDRAEVVNAAVGAAPGRLVLYEVLGNTGQSSLDKERARSRGRIAGEFMVDVISLGEVLSRAGAHVDAAKIDIEGAEYGLIFGSEPSTWHAVGCIALEFDPVSPDGRNSSDELLDRLRSFGYDLDVIRPGFLFGWR